MSRNQELISDRYKNDGISILPFNDRQARYRDLFISDPRINFVDLKECPLCKHTDFIQIAEKDRYGIGVNTAVCAKCGLVFTLNQLDEKSTRIFYSEYYRKIYTGDQKPSHDSLLARYTARQKGKIPTFIEKDDVIVEIGTGGGWNLVKFRMNGNVHYGFDYDADYIEFGRDRLGVNLFVGGVEEARKMDIKADYLLVMQVLEHVRDPMAFLISLKDILNDGAVINLQSPSLSFLIIGGGATGFDLLGTLQCAHNFLFDEFTLRYFAALAGYETVSVLGGHLILKNSGRDQSGLVRHFQEKLNAHPRSAEVIKYLKLVESLVKVKRRLFSQSIQLRLHYLYYLFKPIDLWRKIFLFRC